jgi:hypothetical protein
MNIEEQVKNLMQGTEYGGRRLETSHGERAAPAAE